MTVLSPPLKKVMEPVLCPEPFDSTNFVYQVKWDGVRMLTCIKDTQLRLINKHMRDKTAQYPELHILRDCLQVDSALLDGEVVVLENGKPNFPSILRRDQAGANNVDYFSSLLPINYMVFDLLYLNGQDLRNKPLESRRDLLHEIMVTEDVLHTVEDFPGGKSLFEAVFAMGMEGMVAKRKGSYYWPGKNHQDWLKVKCRRTEVCWLGGFTLRGKLVNALLLGIFREGDFVYVGRAGSGLTAAQQEILSQQLPQLTIRDSPFVNLPSPQKDFYFVQPQMGVLVEYLEWTEDLRLRNPVIKSFQPMDNPMSFQD